MSKKEILKTLDIATYIAAIAATVLVLIFQFTGAYLVMKFAIVMYAVCFMALVILLAISVYDKFAKNKKQDNEESKKEEVNPVTKKDKILSIVWLSLAAIALVLTVALLVVY